MADLVLGAGEQPDPTCGGITLVNSSAAGSSRCKSSPLLHAVIHLSIQIRTLELACYSWCMRFFAKLSSSQHQSLLWVQSLPRTRYGGLALVAAFGRYWPPVKNSPSDVSYKMAGSGRLKRSSTTATSLRSAAAAGAPGLEKSAANPNRELSHFVANLLSLYSFSIQIGSNSVTQSKVSSYKK